MSQADSPDCLQTNPAEHLPSVEEDEESPAASSHDVNTMVATTPAILGRTTWDQQQVQLHNRVPVFKTPKGKHTGVYANQLGVEAGVAQPIQVSSKLSWICLTLRH